jgi:threonine dehydrogenase-like Zn-dependent dehydrogenase
MTEAIPLAVVGAGPAGLAAAAQAAELGLSVTLIDAFHLPGGQYYKQTASELVETAAPDNHAAELLATVKGQSVRLLTETSAWGIFPSPPAPAKALTTCPPREGRLLPLLLGEEGADQRSGGEGETWPFDGFLALLYILLFSFKRFALAYMRQEGTAPLLNSLSWMHLNALLAGCAAAGLIVWNLLKRKEQKRWKKQEIP